MGTITAETIRGESMASRGIEPDERRCAELAADVTRLIEAAHAMRGRLDFNAEPARFAALLAESVAAGGRHK